MDLESYGRWDDSSRARDDMFAATNTPYAPWHIVHSDDKKRARLNTIRHLLSQVTYEIVPRNKPELPKRKTAGDDSEPDHRSMVIPEPY